MQQATADDMLQILQKLPKNINIIEFQYHILNRHEKYIGISTNMPRIGLVICG